MSDLHQIVTRYRRRTELPANDDLPAGRDTICAALTVQHAGQHLEIGTLGGVDKFESSSGGDKVRLAEKPVGQLVVAGSDGAIGLDSAEHAFDPVTLLVPCPVGLNRYPTFSMSRNDGSALPFGR